MSESFEVPIPTAAPVMPGLRVAVLGAGKMGGILLQAFLKNNLLAADQIFATVQHAERAQALSAQFGVEVTTDNLAAAQQADVILLGVKPIQVPALIEEIKSALTPKKMVGYRRWSGLRVGGNSSDAEYAGDAGCGNHGSLWRAIRLRGADGSCAEDLSDGRKDGRR